ncbi:hypothetical protein LEP1GSC050_4197 [Leptospira broomii serovar Hurstbridge str. 5399]|uniref:Uncharacterized protein n=1 Tax=Leptospira broomii serovar Hurstbridge str. 5399 TaxID=1049789 RepID=T0FCR1_9LEPT|nr:hypothetical protein LEP1GSC050_4197 [Leptospira broomii serovar Hurstbridge str. 5399]
MNDTGIMYPKFFNRVGIIQADSLQFGYHKYSSNLFQVLSHMYTNFSVRSIKANTRVNRAIQIKVLIVAKEMHCYERL